jgi:hypothetical protein
MTAARAIVGDAFLAQPAYKAGYMGRRFLTHINATLRDLAGTQADRMRRHCAAMISVASLAPMELTVRAEGAPDDPIRATR